MKIFLIILSLFFSIHAKDFFSANKDGWFWYERKKMDNNKTKEENFMANIPLQNLNSMTAEEFRKTFEKVRDIVVINPTFENVQTMRIMQKYMTDQSEKLTKVFTYANIVDPKHNYNDVGSGGFTNELLSNNKNALQKAKYLTDDIVFVTFVKNQNSQIAKGQIVKNLDFRSLGVDARTFEYTSLGEPQLVKKLGLKEDIENFVFKKKEKKWVLIRKGPIDPTDFIKDFIFLEENKNIITHNKDINQIFKEK